MTPEKAGTVFRELLQTSDGELGWFSRRAGLASEHDHEDLRKARELLQCLAGALASGPGTGWDRVQAAWSGMRQRHGAVETHTSSVAKPQWVRDLPPKPSLGAPAPGTEPYQAQQAERARFVPAAQPAHHAPPAVVSAPAPMMPPAARPPAGRPPVPKRAAAQAPPPPPRGEPVVVGGQMTLARYAAFCAACSTNPERVAVVEAEYGIHSAAQRAALDDHWQDEFDDDPALLAQWEQLCSQFRASLANRR